MRAPISTPDPQSFAAAVLAALELPLDRADWVIALEEWRDFQQHPKK
jgi:hypothetical protein